jgi:hypothetical protein
VPLSDLKIRTAKRKEGPYKLADEHGLYLLVTPAGGKLWRYKFRFEGREKLLSLGAYPVLTLSGAREAHMEARRMLSEGLDPCAEKRKAKTNSQADPATDVLNRFEGVAWQWFKKWKTGKDKKYVENSETRLKGGILNRIGDRPIDEIQAPEIVQMILAIEARGASDVARRAHQTASHIFRFIWLCDGMSGIIP